MSTIQDIFQQAQLAEAAYANFTGMSILTSPENIALALRTGDGKFSASQAAEFVTHWRVISHQPDTASGFSATIFESLDNPGHYSLAIRGSTDMTDFIDDAELITGTGIAVDQVIDLYNYWQRSKVARMKHSVIRDQL